MRKSIWDKKIPTLLGIMLITAGIFLTSYLVKQGVITIIKATPTFTPQNVRISNITDNSFTVSYLTDANAVGSINFGKDNSFGQTGLDDRDQQTGNFSNHQIHNITVRNLSPNTKYFFSITSGQEKFLDKAKPFEIITGTKIDVLPNKQDPITGSVVTPEGTPPKEAIIYVTTENAQVLSTLIKSDGSFILPLNSMRNSGLNSYYTFTDNSILKAIITGGGLKSNVLLSIQQINPMPIVTLSKDYDFTTGINPVASISAQTESFPSFDNASKVGGVSPEIIAPQDKQNLTDQKPLFKGTALPNETVKIIIHSDEKIETQVQSDSVGNWSYRPPNNLSPGEHTISIITKDASGILQTITRSFTVYASGQQINPGVPTGTPTLSPTTSPIPSQTVTTTSTPVVSETVTLTPSPVASISPSISETATPSATEIITPTATLKPLPPTGNSSAVKFGFLSISAIIIGILLFLLTRGSTSL